jgi:hypothetical protein
MPTAGRHVDAMLERPLPAAPEHPHPAGRSAPGALTMSHPRASARGASSARHELVERLKRDHARVLRAFREFDHLESLQACQQIVQRTCAELKVHAAIEEELFYPAVRDTIDDTDLVAEAEIEHRSIATLVEYIELLSPDDVKYRASFRVLGDYVVHHVREEETEMFPQLVHAAIDWDALATAMAERRAELCDEFGLVCDETAPQADERHPAEAGAAR